MIAVGTTCKVCLEVFQIEDLRKHHLNDKLMWRLVVLKHDLHGQYFPKGKEKLLLKGILCFNRSGCSRLHPQTQNHEINTMV